MILVENDGSGKPVRLAWLDVGASDEIAFIDSDRQLLLSLAQVLLHDLVFVVSAIRRVVRGAIVIELRVGGLRLFVEIILVRQEVRLAGLGAVGRVRVQVLHRLLVVA